MKTQTQVKKQKEEAVNATYLRLTQIKKNSYNPRKVFDEAYIGELSESIKALGLIHAVTVRPLAEDKYELVCGECRFRAHKLAGLKKIRVEIRNLSDTEALKIALTENINRKDITVIEEAQTFQKLLALGNNDVKTLAIHCGRSENYVRDRIKLLELIPEFQTILENQQINISQALAIVKFSTGIQKDVLQNHFSDNAEYQRWFNRKAEDIISMIEYNYTTKLTNYNFDKTECMNCPHNTRQILLFETETCGRCAMTTCLQEKNNTYVLEKALDLQKKYPAILFNSNQHNPNPVVVERLKALGQQVYEISGMRYCPDAPEAPVKEDYENGEEYDEALTEFQEKAEEYNDKMNEIIELEEKNEIQLFVNIGNNTVDLCYIDIASAESEHNSLDKTLKGLQKKLERNHELEIEHVIEDTQKMMAANDIPASVFMEAEEKILYYFLLSQTNRKHFALLGDKYKDKLNLMPQDRQEIIEQPMTEEMKTIIRRDFIKVNLPKQRFYPSDTKMLYDFATLHFADDFTEITEKRKQMYAKQNDTLQQQINVIKGTTTSPEEIQTVETETDPTIDMPLLPSLAA